MTPRSRRSLHSWLRASCLLTAAALMLLFAFSPARAQQLDKPLQTIDDEITAFAFAPDGRIVYAVNRGFKTKKYDLEHDDIWITDSSGKRKRILQGDKFTRGNQPFTYAVEGFRWSPNGRFLLAQLFTTTVDDTGRAEDSTNTLVLEDNGKELRPGGTDSFVRNSSDAVWLLDSTTFIFLTEVLKPKVLFSFKQSNLAGGPGGNVFEGRTFLDAEQVPRSNVMIAAERDHALTGPPRLQELDMITQDDHELATLDGYEGGLRISPSGSKALYFVDKEVLEIRDLKNLARIARLRVGLGVPQWSPDESHIFLKRAVEKKSGDLVAFVVPKLAAFPAGQDVPVLQPEIQPLLHGVTVREFAISPDARFLAIIPPGKRNLLIFPFPALDR